MLALASVVTEHDNVLTLRTAAPPAQRTAETSETTAVAPSVPHHGSYPGCTAAPGSPGEFSAGAPTPGVSPCGADTAPGSACVSSADGFHLPDRERMTGAKEYTPKKKRIEGAALAAPSEVIVPKEYQRKDADGKSLAGLICNRGQHAIPAS